MSWNFSLFLATLIGFADQWFVIFENAVSKHSFPVLVVFCSRSLPKLKSTVLVDCELSFRHTKNECFYYPLVQQGMINFQASSMEKLVKCFKSLIRVLSRTAVWSALNESELGSKHPLSRWFFFDNSIWAQLWKNLLPNQLCLFWM